MSQVIRKQVLDAVRDRDAVFVLGAGVTISATGDASHSWYGLMDSGIRTAVDLQPRLAGEWQREQYELLSKQSTSDWIEVAQNVTSELKVHSGARYAQWLETTVGAYARAISNPSLPEILGLFGLPILTTNYDDVLERLTGRSTATYRQIDRFQSELAKPGEWIIHLHGHWRTPDDVVFGYKSYATAIGDPASQAMIHGLGATRQLVLVGFGSGIADPNFTAFGTWLSSTIRESRKPPVVITIDNDYKEMEQRARQLGFSTLAVGPDHRDIDVFLSDIRRDAGISPADGLAYDWAMLQAKIPRLVRRITKDFDPQVIVTMSGPGTMFAALCLRHFSADPPLLSAVTFPKLPTLSAAGAHFESVALAADWVHLETSRWHIYLPNALRHFPPGTRLLILDDRSIGGNSQKRAANELRALGFEVKTAAFVVAPAVQTEVDYSEEITDHDFTFPWGGKYGRNDPPVP